MNIVIIIFSAIFLVLIITGFIYQYFFNKKYKSYTSTNSENYFIIKPCANTDEGNSGFNVNQIDAKDITYQSSAFLTRECGKNKKR